MVGRSHLDGARPGRRLVGAKEARGVSPDLGLRLLSLPYSHILDSLGFRASLALWMSRLRLATSARRGGLALGEPV